VHRHTRPVLDTKGVLDGQLRIRRIESGAALLQCAALEVFVSVFNPYVLVGLVVAAFGLVALVVSRMRRMPSVDQVSPNVLDRIRTEYR
jgi:hypothetical protein